MLFFLNVCGKIESVEGKFEREIYYNERERATNEWQIMLFDEIEGKIEWKVGKIHVHPWI